MTIPRRGLQDIRTLSGQVGKATIPYMAFLRISHIELEKARRSRESESARQRINDIDTRLAEIEAEKTRLLQTMGERAGAPDRSGAKVRPGPSGFRIKY